MVLRNCARCPRSSNPNPERVAGVEYSERVFALSGVVRAWTNFSEILFLRVGPIALAVWVLFRLLE